MPEVGETAPDFLLPDQDGKNVALSELRGQPVVLYFYPKDDTSGCTAQACAFRDAQTNYDQTKAIVIGVSPDDSASHKKFANKFQLPFRLVADVEKTVCQTYGVWKEKNMYGRKYWGVERTTFIIGPDGVIREIFRKVKVNGHAQAVLKVLNTL